MVPRIFCLRGGWVLRAVSSVRAGRGSHRCGAGAAGGWLRGLGSAQAFQLLADLTGVWLQT